MKKCLIILLLLSAVILMYAAQQITVKRDRAVLRVGPGSYQEVIKDLPVGTVLTVLEEDDDWVKVQDGDKTGWVSLSVTQNTGKKNNLFSQMGKQSAGTDVSRHGMSAGVKGFGERFTEKYKGNKSFLDDALSYTMDTRSYERFRKDTYHDFSIKKNKKAIKLPPKNVPEFFSFSEEGFGLGVASAIAAQGIYSNQQLQEYVNQVGNLLVEASDASDVNFRFFILDIDAPNAYACPGGIIFVTKGMLRLIDNEAELAFVLAHEITHVSRFHGMKELENRKNQIYADQAMDEMDEELPDDFYPEEIQATEKELEDTAFDIFETIIQGRLEKYEKEADQIGFLIVARAGYDPNASLSILNRLMSATSTSNNQHYTKESCQKRIDWITPSLSQTSFPDNLFRNQERYKQNANF